MSKSGRIGDVVQDWEPVVVIKRHKYGEKPNAKDLREGKSQVVAKRGGNSKAAQMRKLEEAEDVVPVAKVSLELRLQIQQARTAKGMKQKDLAQRLNVPVSIVQRYENGSAVPSGLFISRLEKTLGCRLSRPKKKASRK